jgi:hypothetical protein
MFAQKISLALASVVILGLSCTTQTSSIIQEFSQEAEKRFLWVGTGTSYRFEENDWIRTPEQDYEFLVKQDRYQGFWQSLKVQNRISDQYDGTAGPSDQMHSFFLDYQVEKEKPVEEGFLGFRLTSTYGDGFGSTNADFTRARMEFSPANGGMFLPYNRYRITQEYDYEAGTLNEWVELYSLKEDGSEVPFVKIQEKAVLYH